MLDGLPSSVAYSGPFRHSHMIYGLAFFNRRASYSLDVTRTAFHFRTLQPSGSINQKNTKGNLLPLVVLQLKHKKNETLSRGRIRDASVTPRCNTMVSVSIQRLVQSTGSNAICKNLFFTLIFNCQT